MRGQVLGGRGLETVTAFPGVMGMLESPSSQRSSGGTDLTIHVI